MNCTKIKTDATPDVVDEASDDDFRAWLTSVNRLCLGRWGLSLDDLPDMPTRSGFDAGAEPEEFFEDEVVPLALETFGSDTDLDEDEPRNPDDV